MTRLLRTARTARARLADWRTWLHGLVGAIIGGGANAIVVMVVDPAGFNFAEGFTKLWQFTALSALVSGALYLKQTPLPPLTPEQELSEVLSRRRTTEIPPATPDL